MIEYRLSSLRQLPRFFFRAEVRKERPLPLLMLATMKSCLLTNMRDVYVEQDGWRIHPRAHLGFACLAEVKHALIKRDVTRVNFDKYVSDPSQWPTKHI